MPSKTQKYIESHTTQKPLICNRCGGIILKSDLSNYPYQCMACDEDVFSIETHEGEHTKMLIEELFLDVESKLLLDEN